MERLTNFSFPLSPFPFFSPLMLKTAAIWIWRNATTSPKHFAKETFGFEFETFETFDFIQEQPRLQWKGCSCDHPSSIKKESSVARNSEEPRIIGAARRRMMKKQCIQSSQLPFPEDEYSFNWALSYFLARVGRQKIRLASSLEAPEVLRWKKRYLLTLTSQGI